MPMQDSVNRKENERHRRPPLAPLAPINRVLRVMLQTRWSAKAWTQVRVEFRKALALRSQIRRAGWFN
jgi:hypothetical protein